MLIEAVGVSESAVIDADLCIVGGGAIGSALAYALRHSPLTIAILESGDINDDFESRGFLSGKNIGKDVFQLGGQRRRFGGGMHDWSGNCSLLETNDFQPVQGDQPQWPISCNELSKYTDQVSSFLKIDCNFGKDALIKTAVSENMGRRRLPFLNQAAHIQKKTFLRSKVRLPHEYYNDIVLASPGIKLITGATVSGLVQNEQGTAITEVSAISEAGQFSIRAKQLVLASGLENAPILLRALGVPGDEQAHRLPALGRYLHSHLLSLRGFLVPYRDKPFFSSWSLPGDLDIKARKKITHFAGLQVNTRLRKKKAILNSAMFLAPLQQGNLADVPEVFQAAKAATGGTPHNIYAIRHFIEQPPRWNSRVTLGKLQGNSPLPRPEYNWRVGEEEDYSIAQNLEVLGASMQRHKLANVLPVSCGEEHNPIIFARNAHPMGGTLMGDNIKTSVVDSNCRVHGFDNLYVCGSSVLPSSGAAMVTAVILQLSFRLADHLLQFQPRASR